LAFHNQLFWRYDAFAIILSAELGWRRPGLMAYSLPATPDFRPETALLRAILVKFHLSASG